MLQINPIYTDYDQVFKHYYRRSNDLIMMSKRALKTDCFNEYDPQRQPIALDETTQLIEYNQDHIDKALALNPKLKIDQGDIRDLPYRDWKFDLVLDLSTLDHIPQDDTKKAISEYERVLEPKGKCLIITWFADSPKNPFTWNPDNQYFFSYDKVKEYIEEYFTIEDEQLLLKASHPEQGIVYLYEFLLRKY